MEQPHYHPTNYWHRTKDNHIQCDICPRACKLNEGQRGLCFVRMRQDDAIVLTTYGRSSGFCIDPVEKKPLNHFLPGTPVLSFGTAGCNSACKFCQNWDMSKSRDMDKLAQDASPETIANVAHNTSCTSIAFTYNDPVIFMEYAIDTAIACHEKNIKTIAVSAGYICPEPRMEFFNYMDAANIDLKSFSEDFYYQVTGTHLQDVLDTLIYLKHHTNVWFEITTLLIPDENDSEAELEAMTQWIYEALGPDVPLHFTAFHPDYKMRNKSNTPLSTLQHARNIAIKNGLRYVYLGNVHDKAESSTYCVNCGTILIGRDWYQLSDWHLNHQGNCLICGHACPGVFNGPPGDWGPKRQPVRW